LLRYFSDTSTSDPIISHKNRNRLLSQNRSNYKGILPCAVSMLSTVPTVSALAPGTCYVRRAIIVSAARHDTVWALLSTSKHRLHLMNKKVTFIVALSSLITSQSILGLTKNLRCRGRRCLHPPLVHKLPLYFQPFSGIFIHNDPTTKFSGSQSYPAGSPGLS
jgi:hypothetical protein